MLGLKITPVEIGSMIFPLGEAYTGPNPRLTRVTGFQCFLHKHCKDFTTFHCLRCFHDQKKKCFAGPDHLGKYWCSCCEILLVCACVTLG